MSSFTMTLASVADLMHQSHRAASVGYVSACFSVGILIGPVLGGYMSSIAAGEWWVGGGSRVMASAQRNTIPPPGCTKVSKAAWGMPLHNLNIMMQTHVQQQRQQRQLMMVLYLLLDVDATATTNATGADADAAM